MDNLVITSSAFENGGIIPKKYTRNGEDKSPPIQITGVDPLAKSIAIIVDDPDIPIPYLTFTHWVVYNIPAEIAEIAEIEENIPHVEVIQTLGGALQGKNGFRRTAYLGPDPPFGTHTYRFMVYTLDTLLDLKPGAGRKQLERAMEGHILQTGLLEGKFGAK
ncbi:MAG TPA: YbhB/YbcL family Raf kinase inhibitor-like protein [Anaerovoracaceae bacterium]|nr:YbhB/YbcL family Raf kinase inhibitor-like protein [Anaerovoracaceae bacterium]